MTTRTSLYTTRIHVPCLGRGYTLKRLTEEKAHWEYKHVHCTGCGGAGIVLKLNPYRDVADWLGL